MLPPHRFARALAPENPAPRCSNFAYTRIAVALLPGARLSPWSCRPLSLPPLVPVTTALLLAGSHALALTAPTISLAVGLRVPAQPPPKAAHNTKHDPVECFPSPRSPREPPTHTRGSSPTSRGVAPGLPARSAATSSCREAKQRSPIPALLHHHLHLQRRLPLPPPEYNHQRRRRAA